MKVTYEERPLEELENEIVEYIINTPHNANPNVIRSMVSAAAENVSMSSDGQEVYFRVKKRDSYNVTTLSYMNSDNSPSDEEIIIPLLKNKLNFLRGASDGEEIIPGMTNMTHIIGFSISDSNKIFLFGSQGGFALESEGIGTKIQEIATDYFANL